MKLGILVAIFLTLALTVYPLRLHCSAIRLGQTSVSNHQQLFQHTFSQPYVQKLVSQQDLINAGVANLQNLLKQANQTVTQETDIDRKIKLLEQQILKQRKTVQALSEKLVRPLQEEQWSCPKMDQTKKEDITAFILQLNGTLDDLDKDIGALDQSKVPARKDIKNDIEAARDSNNAINTALNSNGKEYQPKYSGAGQSGINSKENGGVGGIGGSGTGQPDQGGSGMEQPEEGGEGTRQPGQGQSGGAGQSEQGGSGTGQQGEGTSGTGQNGAAGSEKSDQTGATGLAGQGGNSQKNIIYIPNIYAPNWFLGNKKKDQLNKEFLEYKDKYDQVIVCPIDRPFTDGKRCFNCSGDTGFFDIEKEQCVPCFTFNSKSNSCNDKTKKTVNFIDLQNPEKNQGILLPENKTIEDAINEQKQLKQDSSLEVTTCPKDKPYFNGVECIACDQGLLFSLQDRSCQTCPEGQAYNKMTYHCGKKGLISRLDGTKWAAEDPEALRKKAQKAKKQGVLQECPVDLPFLINDKCQACSSLEYFNMDTSSCESCPKGQVLDQNLHKCVAPDNNYHITNPKTAKNLIYDGISKNEWMNIYYNDLNKNEGVADCPRDKPYFDGTSCIDCSKDQPYFNLKARKCQDCIEGTEYDSSASECLTAAGDIAVQTPTLEKMGAGIFT